MYLSSFYLSFDGWKFNLSKSTTTIFETFVVSPVNFAKNNILTNRIFSLMILITTKYIKFLGDAKATISQ